MLDNEEINTQERIAALENKVQKQAEEISYLKSTLSDVIKRIQSLESNKILPSSAQIKVSHSALSKSFDQHNSLKSSTSSSVLSNSSSSSLTKSKSNLNTSKSNLRRENSSSNRDRSQSVKPSQSLLSASPSFNKSTGLVKFYLKGRPINLYLPNSLFDEVNDEFNFDIDSKIKKPEETLKLEWVYGYRGKDARSNLYQLSTGEVVYFMAAVVVLHNIDENTQRHYLGHNDDIKSIAIHPDKIHIATGQSAGHNPNGKAHVRIWDSINLTTLKVIGLDSSNNEFQNSISCLSFSICDSGRYLAIVDDGNDRWLSVWDWNKSDKIVSQKSYGDMVFCVEWHPIDRQMLITCGKQHVHFWIVDFDTRHLAKRNALFELNTQTDVILAHSDPKVNNKYEKPKYCLALVCNLKGDIIVGDSDGNILFWNHKDKDLKITRIIKDAHEGGVFSLYSSQSENVGFSLISAGKDGKIIEWNNEYKKTGRHLEINSSCRCVLPMNQNASEILIGTTKNTIYRGVMNDAMSIRLIVNSHSDELWGLGNNLRDSNFFLTCGNDKNLNYWDSLSHTLVWSHQFTDEQPHCLDIHPQYDLVSIGFGKIKILFCFFLY
jgi:microtubule-associated protein-like 1/2